MESFLLSPRRPDPFVPDERFDPTIHPRIANSAAAWLRKNFSRDVRQRMVQIGPRPVDDRTSEYPHARPLGPSQDASNATTTLISFPRLGAVLAHGPAGLGAALRHYSRRQGYFVRGLNQPRSVTSATRRGACAAYPPDEEPWHLGARGINIDEATRLTSGRGVRVGFIDTGIDSTHEEFKGRQIQGASIDEFGAIATPLATVTDANGHGTHVAGLCAGRRYGVAPNAELAIACCPLVLYDGGEDAIAQQVLTGLEYLVTLPRGDGRIGVDVINLSLGLPGYSRVFTRIMPIVRGQLDSLVIAAIGNRGAATHDSPGDYLGVHGIGAHDGYTIWADSSWGHVGRRSRLVPHYVAPGVGVWAARAEGGYEPRQGSSMAAAIAAGLAAAQLSSIARRSDTQLHGFRFRTRPITHDGQEFHRIVFA